ncbi:MAG: PEP-CTERM system histidine kinase PrsK, partial [Deltaproteobacteria bacterium]|nr:PEP-CTERM system histidine kinase PrsK [Deltaproteobacteria bacterium]
MLLSSGISLLVPLILEKRFAGVLGLSASRSGYGMDHEDLTLITTIANQAAASLLSAKFSQDLLHAKEVEAFHAFSAFVVHDLKNFV